MKNNPSPKLALLLASVAATSAVQAQTLFSDNFETDTSANYTVVNDGTLDGTVLFGFDYVAAGIPLAPNSTAGNTKGLRITSNDSAGAVDALTVFHNTAVTAPAYKMSVDVFMSFSGTTATTEHAHVGVGGNGTTFNSIFTPISGSGSFIGFTGDGGSGSDYRWFLDEARGGATTYPNTDGSYLGHGSNNTGSFYQSLFPSSTVPGSPGNIWTTLEIEVNSGTVSFSFDNQLTLQGTYTGELDGLVSLGLNDLFSSVAPAGANVYVVYDNLTVQAVPEPATAGLASLGLGLVLWAARRRKA